MEKPRKRAFHADSMRPDLGPLPPPARNPFLPARAKRKAPESFCELKSKLSALRTQCQILLQRNLELEAQKTGYARLLEAASMACITLDSTGSICQVNQAALRFLGIDNTQWIHQPFHDFLAPEAGQSFDVFLRGVMASAKVKTLAIKLKIRDGLSQQSDAACQAFGCRTGSHCRLLLTRTLARDPARPLVDGNEEQYRSFFENAAEGVFRTTLDGRFLAVNPAFARMTGYDTPDSFIAAIGNCAPNLYVYPKQRTEYLHLIEKFDVLMGFECQIRHRDGSCLWVTFNTRAIRGPDGKTRYYEGMVENISQRKEAEARIQRQAALLDISQDAILVLDLEYHIQYANPGFERLFGWTAVEMLGRQLFPESLVECRDKLKQARQQTINAGQWNGELVFRNKDRQRIVVSSRCTLVRDEQGNPSAILVVNSDITEQKKLLEQLLTMQREESAGRLANGVAHDLNNMLAPIIVAADLLTPIARSKEAREFLAMIKNSATRGADMVRQLLLYCRGTQEYGVELDLAKMTVEMARFARETFPKNIEIQLDLCSAVWPVVGDPAQFHQILINLCVNARDAMTRGGSLGLGLENVELQPPPGQARPEIKPGPYVALRVWDTGTGIPNDVLTKIFDPYFTTKPKGQGTGLGLSTVQGIVKRWGGFINVESHEGLGTQFLVYIPARKTIPNPPPSTVQSVDYLGNGELILVVDDEELIRLSTIRILELYGYRVILACHGKEALSMYRQHPDIQAVLLDMWMPYLDGLSTIVELAKINPSVRIIASSGLTEFQESSKNASPVVKAFLPKPWQKNDLLKTLKQVLPGSLK